MSQSYEDDDEFIQLVRNLFSLTELKPPPPQLTTCRASKFTPKAKQVFGDFISWNQTVSAKELAEPVRNTKTKIECPYKESDFMGWKEDAKKAEVPDDFYLTQYSVKRKNIGKGNPNLLEWKAQSTNKQASSNTLTSWKQSHPSSRIKVVEGSSPQEGFTKVNYQWSKSKKEQYAGGCPFGKEEVAAENKSQTPLKPRSLADILAQSK